MGTMTLFTEQFAQDNLEEIHRLTRCGNLVELYLDPNVYFGAKATSWTEALEVLEVQEFLEAFAKLESGEVEALTMSIPLFLMLRDNTEVVDGEDLVFEGNEQVTVFDETLENYSNKPKTNQEFKNGQAIKSAIRKE